MDAPDSITMEPEEEIIVRADEVDETGANVSVLSAATDAELTSQVEERSREVSDFGPVPIIGTTEQNMSSPVRGEPRPIIRREGAAPPPPPPPPKQPPPPAPSREESGHMSNDSLSLAQLKSIVLNYQGADPPAYAYNYADSRTFAEEMEEWFQYTVEDRKLLRSMRGSFDQFLADGGSWNTHAAWLQWSDTDRRKLIEGLVANLDKTKPTESLMALEALGYVALGAWKGSYASSVKLDRVEDDDYEPPNARYKRGVGQIHSMRLSAELLCRYGAVEAVWKIFQSTCTSNTDGLQDGLKLTGNPESFPAALSRRRDVCLTILYAAIESGRWLASHGKSSAIRKTFIDLQPSFLPCICQQIARVRWDEEYDLQLTRAVQLLWKGMLLILGSSEDLKDAKTVLTGGSSSPEGDKPQSMLTTNPLDYHIFRQEITSKYPAYNPPPPLLPLEPENNSLLPPLPRSSRSSSVTSMHVEPAKFSKSIFEQPVHITTPIPSPPPSPAGPGGKGVKKQNYQTNQDFPFLYPPLDSSSNDLGGKGGVALQDKLVGKKWTGSDIPASIREAGELFASRMRMSRSTRQLWEAREACIRYDRGWSDGFGGTSEEEDSDEDVREFKLDEEFGSEFQEELENLRPKAKPPSSSKSPDDKPETNDAVVQQRLDLAAAFYRGSLPHLQSIVIVVLKILLANISATGAQSGGNQPSPALPVFPPDRDVDESRLSKSNVNLFKLLSSASNGAAPPQDEDLCGSFESLNSTRIREITSKAIAGMLLTMLKWFRFSHILKFQFLTQLLLDSNYLPLALKYFAMQDVDRAVDRKTDNERLGLFEFCREDAGLKPGDARTGGHRRYSSTDSIDEAPALSGSPDSSEDEAMPPPIRRRRKSAPSPPRAANGYGNEDGEMDSPPSSPRGSGMMAANAAGAGAGAGAGTSLHSQQPINRKPEVDELGYPTTASPQQPVTSYSSRFFFTTIALLRVLQKVSKRHAHRALLLVQYKSSTILRKALKIPQPALRLYTLKLFKGQVPFCGRKWRQANMRVITAIYVFCRMGLRDDWISGAGAVDDWVDNALATEQAWRGLTGWWHSRFYRDAVGLDNDSRTRQGHAVGGGGEVEETGGYGYVDDDEQDFFVRELEKMGWAEGGLEGGDEEEQADWENGLLQPEGW